MPRQNTADLATTCHELFQWLRPPNAGLRDIGGLAIKLFYNDYPVEGMGGKSDQVFKMVQSMKQRNAPINGVGLQFH